MISRNSQNSSYKKNQLMWLEDQDFIPKIINQVDSHLNFCTVDKDFKTLLKKDESSNDPFKEQLNLFTNLANKLSSSQNKASSLKFAKKNLKKLVEDEPKCNICGQIFANKKYIHNHKRFVHGNEEYKCDQCDFKTKRNVYLKYHIEAKHKGVTFDCNLCDHKYIRSNALRSHMFSAWKNCL